MLGFLLLGVEDAYLPVAFQFNSVAIQNYPRRHVTMTSATGKDAARNISSAFLGQGESSAGLSGFAYVPELSEELVKNVGDAPHRGSRNFSIFYLQWSKVLSTC